ncbi:ABC transporter substrate-binding protein [Allonocardiopsis opalescens]|uniref:NitT/TauT family transport system substrate-binding protein n=1 Tax=Allonocardiopsis opalescens TaxID=1144618 RepID=A0A2T0Q084_9ACTN|nr:ABC transporter substrate-binding protein [Allonocardiopsis opalescens]PRX97194.1 NitT/TauT family transport system substrate-binding protein [Allonocardiopsis opalescens]
MKSPGSTQLRLFALLATASLALTACGSGETPAETGSGELEVTEIAVGAIPIVDAGAVHVAVANGYFEEEGLTVTVEPIEGGAAGLPALLNGTYQVIHGNNVSSINAITSGAGEIVWLAEMFQAGPDTFPIMVAEDSEMDAVEDLEGATIAVNTLENIGTLAVEATLRTAGLTAEDVEFVAVPFPEMPAALDSGDVDAAWITEPFVTQAHAELGARILADSMSGPTADFPIAGWMATQEWVEENPNSAAAFQRAILRGQQAAAEDRNAVESLLPEYAGIEPETAAAITFGTFPTTMEAERIQRVADLMFELGYLEEEFVVDPYLLAPPEGAEPSASASPE